MFPLKKLDSPELIVAKGSSTPAGIARAEAPGLSEAKEKAEAVPAESELSAAKINGIIGINL